MTTEAVGRILDTFPPAFLLIVPIMGFIMLFFSPINLFLPQIISNPFSGNAAAAEILERFAIIILVSFAVGVPFSFLENLFVSNSGINNLFRRTIHILYRSEERQKLKGNERKRLIDRLKRIGKETKQQQFPEQQSFIDFWIWLREKNRLTMYNFLVTENAIVNGLLVGSEIALISNIFAFLFFEWARVLFPFIISFLLFAYMLFINYIIWKDVLNGQLNEFKKKFKEDCKENHYGVLYS